ncbi:MAG: sulfurtransferase TusA family protein [Micropepsaceae bacterium]
MLFFPAKLGASREGSTELSMNAADWTAARQLDLTGLKCPMPSLMTAKALRDMAEGDLLAVTVTDALAPLDLRHLCQRDGHALVAEGQNEFGARRLLICRGPRS